MAEEQHEIKSHEQGEPKESLAAEVKDRGLFDFMGKKEEEVKHQGQEIAPEFEQKVQVSEPEKEEEEEEKKPSFLEKLHRTSSSSSSSSDEEEGEEGEKKKKRKERKKKEEDTSVPVEKYEECGGGEAEEKKGFLDKIKEKLPGQGKKAEEHVTPTPPPSETVTPPPPPPPPSTESAEHPAQKKGSLEKIKEKLPGYHSKSTEEEKKEKEAGSD